MKQAITFYRFNKLSKREKYGLLEEHGTYLEVNRLSKAHTIALFQLFGYYVEVWLNQKSNGLEKATAFTSYKKLDKYLKKVDITDIYTLL